MLPSRMVNPPARAIFWPALHAALSVAGFSLAPLARAANAELVVEGHVGCLPLFELGC